MVSWRFFGENICYGQNVWPGKASGVEETMDGALTEIITMEKQSIKASIRPMLAHHLTRPLLTHETMLKNS